MYVCMYIYQTKIFLSPREIISTSNLQISEVVVTPRGKPVSFANVNNLNCQR